MRPGLLNGATRIANLILRGQVCVGVRLLIAMDLGAIRPVVATDFTPSVSVPFLQLVQFPQFEHDSISVVNR